MPKDVGDKIVSPNGEDPEYSGRIIKPGATGDESISVGPDEIDTDTTSTDISDLEKQVADQYEARRRGPSKPGMPRPRRPKPRPKI